MRTVVSTGPGAQRWSAMLAAAFCVLVAVTLVDRRDDERTLRRANVAGAEGRYDEARRLAGTLTTGTTAADAWYLRAAIAANEGRLQAAATALRRSLRQRPNDWRARRDLAGLMVVLGDRRRAFAEYSRAVQLNPGMPPLPPFDVP